MNHAKTISPNNKNTRKATGKTIARATRRLSEMDETKKGRRGNTQGQTPVSSPCDVANAILKAKFLPRLAVNETIQNCNQSTLIKQFYKSLLLVEKKYNITIQDYRDLPFPYNISASLTELRKTLKGATADWRDIRLIAQNTSIYFAQEDRYNTGMTLYYIPVVPLYNLLNQEENVQVAQLLLSVYAYIYSILKVSYYRNDDCYLYATYDTYEELMMEEGNRELSEELQNAKDIGDIIKLHICGAENLQSFEQRLHSFAPKNEFEKKCLEVAQQFFSLYQQYPDTPLDRSFYPLRFREDMEHDRVDVMLDNYVSFCADIQGNLFSNVFQFINEELQEYGEIDEPTRFIPLDGRRIKDNDFHFEHQVFADINDLISLWQYENF